MDDKKDAPHRDYSVDEILAETHIMRDRSNPGPREPAAPAKETPGNIPAVGRSDSLADSAEIARRARELLRAETGQTENPEPVTEMTPEPNGGKPAKQRRSLFGRKKKRIPEFNEEDDLYYGLQLKPLEEYRKEYEKSLQLSQSDTPAEKPESRGGSSFPYLFGGESQQTDADLKKTFDRVHEERQKRLEKIMRNAGLDPNEILPPEAPKSSAGPQRASGSQPALSSRPAAGTHTADGPQPGPQSVPTPELPPQPPAVLPGPEREPQEMPLPQEPAGPEQPPVIFTQAPKQTPEPKNEPDWDFPTEETPQNSEEPEPAEPETPEPQTVQKTVCEADEQPPVPMKEPLPTPPTAKEELPKREPREEPHGPKRPEYRAAAHLPLHVVNLEGLGAALAEEATEYAVPETPVLPIPFPKQEKKPEPEPEAEPVPQPEPESEPELEIQEEIPAVSIQQDAEPVYEEEESAPDTPPEPIPIPVSTKAAPYEPKKHFRLFGSEEAENDPDEIPEGEEEELDDYTSPTDAPSVLHELIANVNTMLLRCAVTGIISLLLILLSVVYEYPAFLTPDLHSVLTPQFYLIVSGVFLIVSALFSVTGIWNGIKGLFLFQANSDSASALAVLACLVQNIVLLVLGLPDGLHLYTALAAAALFLNAAGKLSMSRRILHNFRFVSAPGAKYAVRIFDDYNTSLRLAENCVIGEPRIACQTEASFLKHFLRLSYLPDPADHLCQVLAPIGFLLSVALCGVCAYMSRDAVTAVSVLAASCCVCVPFANMLGVNLPLARLSRVASRCGGMISGWPAVEHFSETNAVLMDAADLFPRGTVILNGIRTFAGQRIDDAIIDAAALTCTVGGPLSDLFDQIIKSRRDLLPKIERCVYRDEKGIIGMVSGRKTIVGSRELMKEEGIEPPSRDYEDRYLRGGKRIVYLASDDTLVAMFIVSYRSDRRRALELRRMESNGISLIVRTSDPNITPLFLSECFGIDPNGVRILPEELGKVYTGLRGGEPDGADALMATKGRAAAMTRLLTACVRQRGNISAAAALLAAGAALGFALVAFLSLYSGLRQLSTAALLVFEAFWAAAVILVPHIRRP